MGIHHKLASYSVKLQDIAEVFVIHEVLRLSRSGATNTQLVMGSTALSNLNQLLSVSGPVLYLSSLKSIGIHHSIKHNTWVSTRIPKPGEV